MSQPNLLFLHALPPASNTAMTGFCLPVDRTEHAKFGKEVTTVHDTEFPNIRL